MFGLETQAELALKAQVRDLQRRLDLAHEPEPPGDTYAELAFKAHIADLQQRLQQSETEKLDLLNRLLERHNVSAVGVPAPPKAEPIQVLSPFPSMPPEMEDAVKDSWLNEETEYIIQTRGLSPDLARAEAERSFTAQHQTIT